MKIIVLLLLTISSSYASIYTDVSRQTKFVEKEYREYLDAFWELYSSYSNGSRKYYTTISIVTDKTSKDNSIAECWDYSIGNDIIVINKDRFSKQSVVQQMATIFHELNHCVLKFRGHIDGVHPEDASCPATLMHSRKISNRCLNKHFKYYINRLVGPNRDKSGK